jgi:trans-2,3-dihydro-3-hydroxyanthranilate isomerase
MRIRRNPLKSRKAIDRARPNSELLLPILASVSGEGCYLFSLDPVLPGSHAQARFFNPTVGVLEDAATGTAACPLAALLVAKGLAESASYVVIEQGFAMDRTSVLRVSVRDQRVKIVASAVVAGAGVLHIQQSIST